MTYYDDFDGRGCPRPVYAPQDMPLVGQLVNWNFPEARALLHDDHPVNLREIVKDLDAAFGDNPPVPGDPLGTVVVAAVNYALLSLAPPD